MEEILASIRRIISDEETGAGETAAVETEPEADMAEGLESAADEDISEDDLEKLFASDGGDTPESEGLTSAADEDISEDDLEKLFAADGGFDAPEPEPAPAVEEEPEDEPLDLSLEAEIDEEPLELVEEMSPEEDDVVFSFDEAEPEPEPEVVDEAPDMTDIALAAAASLSDEKLEAAATEALLSPQANAAVSTAFDNLAHTIISSNARTIEDLIQEMLRPMLKGWLDDNLPGIVERLVRAEIERVSRGARR